MHVTFVALGSEQLAISQLSAITRQEGHTVGLAFSAALFNDRFNLSLPSIAPYFDDRQEAIEAIKQQKPDVLAFSVLTGTYQWMLGVAKEAKELFPNIKVIFGGVHVSAVPDRVLAQPQVDYVVVGEGDLAFPQILKAIERGGATEPICNTQFKRPDNKIVRGEQTGFIQDLNSLPVYDKTLWEDHICIKDFYMTMASRGCPYRCTFCFNNFFANLPDGKKGKYVRQRSVDHMMFELIQAKKRYNYRFVDFEDDIFTVDKKWMRIFLKRYKNEIGVEFSCLTHPKYIDEELAGWLYEAGCRYVQMGVQTMDDEFKYTIVKRYEKTDHVQTALDVMRKKRLKVKSDHMFGLPGEPKTAQEEARKLFVEHPPHRIQTYWTNFLPGTEMVDQAFKMGLITTEDIDRLNDGLDFDFFRTTNNIPTKEKVKFFKAYEVTFKIIPLLPLKWRRKLDPKFFQKIPPAINSLVGFLIDTSCGLLTFNPTHTSYAKHYIFRLYRLFVTKLGLKAPTATRIKATADPYRFTPPKRFPRPITPKTQV